MHLAIPPSTMNQVAMQKNTAQTGGVHSVLKDRAVLKGGFGDFTQTLEFGQPKLLLCSQHLHWYYLAWLVVV